MYFHESFHLLPWKVVEASVEVGNRPASMEVTSFASVEVGNRPASMQIAPTSVEVTNYFHGNWKEARFRGGSSSVRLGIVLWSQLEVCDARGFRWKYVGVYGSSWNLPQSIFIEAATDGINGTFHFDRQWKLACTSTDFLEVNLCPPTSMEISMEVNILAPTSMEVNLTSMEVGGNFHGGSRSSGSRWTLMEGLWEQLEVCDTRGGRRKNVRVSGSSWKLPRTTFVEATIVRSNERFHFHRQWKVPCISMEASTNFHRSKSTCTNFHGSFHGNKSTSTDLHGSFHGSKFASMNKFTSLETSMKVDRKSKVMWRALCTSLYIVEFPSVEKMKNGSNPVPGEVGIGPKG